MRLDQLLVEAGHCDSREQAKRLILAGEVLVAGHPCDKPATKVSVDTAIAVREKPRYVGRGGLKLEGALEHFRIDPSGFTCLDIGASTGGFTDCLLQAGARRVHAIDVGTNQLAWKIRSDPRVVVREKFNARQLVLGDLGGERIDLVVIDVSFISLKKILPAAAAVLVPGGRIVALIKPQFELARHEVGKGGIVRDAALHEQAVDSIRCFVSEEMSLNWIGFTPSSITGADGNQEFLALLESEAGGPQR
jgi:23S rRNA (cytidine1920-2'-O)/16S rRNA (cytidine1409-2'-O)-methyltransferase